MLSKCSEIALFFLGILKEGSNVLHLYVFSCFSSFLCKSFDDFLMQDEIVVMKIILSSICLNSCQFWQFIGSNKTLKFSRLRLDFLWVNIENCWNSRENILKIKKSVVCFAFLLLLFHNEGGKQQVGEDQTSRIPEYSLV